MKNPTETPTLRPQFWLRAIEHRKHRLTREYRATLGDAARASISDEDYATTMTTLEQMARNLGWTEADQDEHESEHGHGHGHDRGHGRGHRRRHGRFGHRTLHPEAPDA